MESRIRRLSNAYVIMGFKFNSGFNSEIIYFRYYYNKVKSVSDRKREKTGVEKLVDPRFRHLNNSGPFQYRPIARVKRYT